MFCLAPGSEVPLRVDPERFYETADGFAEKFDLIYWMCVLLQTTIETCFGLFVRLFRFPLKFLGCILVFLDKMLDMAFWEIRFHCLISAATGKWETRIQESFKAFHQRLAEQSALSSMAVGALLDVLQLRLDRVPILATRCLPLLVADVVVLVAAAKYSVERVLQHPLASLEEGYLYTYTQFKRESAFSNMPCSCGVDGNAELCPEGKSEQSFGDDSQLNPERDSEQSFFCCGDDPELNLERELEESFVCCGDDPELNPEWDSEKPGIAVCNGDSLLNPERESEQPGIAVCNGDLHLNPERESECHEEKAVVNGVVGSAGHS